MPKDSPATTLHALAAGLAHHQAGRLAEAEAAYRRVLAREPAQPSALYLCGLLLLATARPAAAEPLLAAAAALRPAHAETCFAHANALHRNGNRVAAIARLRALLAREPDHLGARVNLSNCLREYGEQEAALAEAEAACRLRPASAPAETTRAAALLALKRPAEAIASYRAAIACGPRHAAAHAGLAAAFLHAERPAEALASADAALLLAPALAEAEFLRAMALAALGTAPAAITGLERAIARDPGHAKAHLNLGNLLANEDRLAAAERHCRRAIALDPDLVEAHASLAHLLTAQGRTDEAIAACDEALARAPDFVPAEWNQGIALLLAGDYARGWERYETRRPAPRYAPPYPEPEGPVWHGEPLVGKNLLVYGEQGLGDTIQFARYLPLLAARGALVTLACDRALAPLISGQLGLAAIVPIDRPFPPMDLWVNQMSLPHRFATRLCSIPSPGRYLAADPERARRFAERLPASPRVGLVWAGNPRHSNDARRSIPPGRLALDLAPLLAVPGLSFVSLQVGPRAEEAADLPGLLDLSAELTDFAADRGADRGARPGGRGRHRDRALRRRARQGNLDHAAARARLALAHRARGFPLVCLGAPLPPARARRLAASRGARRRRARPLDWEPSRASLRRRAGVSPVSSRPSMAENSLHSASIPAFRGGSGEKYYLSEATERRRFFPSRAGSVSAMSLEGGMAKGAAGGCMVRG